MDFSNLFDFHFSNWNEYVEFTGKRAVFKDKNVNLMLKHTLVPTKLKEISEWTTRSAYKRKNYGNYFEIKNL